MGWKLVRDYNETWSTKHGVSGTWRQADDKEAVRALARKLFEEAGEYLENRDPGELLDLKDALDELLHLVLTAEAAGAHIAKAREHGGFRDHVMWTPLPDAR